MLNECEAEEKLLEYIGDQGIHPEIVLHYVKQNLDILFLFSEYERKRPDQDDLFD